MSIKEETVAVPKSGLYFTGKDVQQARRNIEIYPWAREKYEALRRACDEHLQLSDEHLYRVVLGMKDATFAYGISGCPKCGQPFPLELEDQLGMFSSISEWPRKTVTCPHCGTVFPNEEYPDDGNGLERDGKAYYLIGMWNFYHAGLLFGGVRNHEGLVTRLVAMYMLTGDARYAKRALLLLDAFSAIFPGTLGPRDFTPYGSDFEIGRLHLLTSIVHRVKVWLAHDYDWLYRLPELDGPSPALRQLGREGTIRQNIETMLNDYMLTEPGGPYYDLTDGNLTNLQNHEADGVRAMLAVGLVSDREDYCKWGADSLTAYFYNAIGRDGMYFESSYGYSLFTASVYLDLALLSMRAAELYNWDIAHPFANARFFRFAVENPLDMLCEGHMPSYGDWGADRRIGKDPDVKLCLDVYRSAQFFYRYSPDEVIRMKAGETLRLLYPIVESKLGERSSELFLPHNGVHSPSGSRLDKKRHFTVMGQSGVSIIRSSGDTTALMRFGRNNTHGHDDVLAYSYYAGGKEISADIGYSVYGTNAHYGWASKSIAHNTVVVNQDEGMRKNQLFKIFSGGELTLLYSSETVAAMEGDATELYGECGVEQYRRMIGLVDNERGGHYVIDFFRVEGARVTDYAFHAFQSSSTLELRHAQPSPRKHWTLAGVDSPDKLYFDEPGKSLGERLTTGETFVPLLPGEEPRLWTPERNNGYGFIYNVQEYLPDQELVYAVWNSEQQERLHWFGLCGGGDRIFTGLCPDLEGGRKHAILVHRSSRPVVQYAVVTCLQHDARQRMPVEGVASLSAEGRHVTALAVSLPEGYTDYWLYSPSTQTMKLLVQGQEWTVTGRCALLRLDREGRVVRADCIQAQSMSYGDYQLYGREDKWLTIDQIDEQSGTVWVPERPPLKGDTPRFVRLRSPHKGASVVYRVNSMHVFGNRTAIQLTDSLILSKGIVRSVTDHEMETLYPLPLGVAEKGKSPFAGKRIVGQRGGLGTIVGVPELKKLQIQVVRPFTAGEAFDIVDLEPGYELQWL